MTDKIEAGADLVCTITSYNFYNHKNYNFLDYDWFKNSYSSNLLAKLLSDSFLLDCLS